MRVTVLLTLLLALAVVAWRGVDPAAPRREVGAASARVTPAGTMAHASQGSPQPAETSEAASSAAKPRGAGDLLPIGAASAPRATTAASPTPRRPAGTATPSVPVRRHAPRSREHARAIAAHIASPAFHDAAAPVARLYLASFGRVPDYEGFEHYLGERGRGTSLADIAEEIAGSPEFEMRHGPLDDAAFLAAVERLAQVALEPGERGRWLADLAAGRMTRGEILIAISETAAFRSVTANEVFVAMAYAEALQRAPDAGELARWVAFLDAGNPRTALLERLLAGG